jgi:hypothetical protein
MGVFSATWAYSRLLRVRFRGRCVRSRTQNEIANYVALHARTKFLVKPVRGNLGHEHGSRWAATQVDGMSAGARFGPRHLPTKSASFSMAAALQDIEDGIFAARLVRLCFHLGYLVPKRSVDEDAIQAVGEAIASVPPLPQHLPSGGETFRTRISGPGMDSNEDSRLDSSHCGNSSRLQVECLQCIESNQRAIGLVLEHPGNCDSRRNCDSLRER